MHYVHTYRYRNELYTQEHVIFLADGFSEKWIQLWQNNS
jgi:hypothetical protein